MTRDEMGAAAGPGLAPDPLRLTGRMPPRRAPLARTPAPFEHDRGGRRRGPERNVERLARRRRSANRHAVIASLLAILALVGCVIAILMLATEPTAARLEHEVSALTSRLDAAQTRLAALQTTVGETASQRSRLQHDVNSLGGRVSGLSHTVHGLQGATTSAAQQAAGLRACVPQLQAELDGLTVKTRLVGGKVTSVGLTDPALLSASCAAAGL